MVPKPAVEFAASSSH